MDLRFGGGLLACLLCACTTPSAISNSATHQQAGPQCNLLPAEVWSSTAYAGWSQGQLCNAGQGPLWQGTPDGIARITRFTFTHGHASFFRYAVISERDDGRAWIEFGGGGYGEDGVRSGWEALEPHRRDLSAEDLARFNALAESTGTFEHSVGTWDGGELYMHCQLLEMERAEGSDYSFSSVNIGCNQPERLMPLVRHVMDLAWLEFAEEGRLIR
ncbi:hypothetical protein [Aurantiacibacter gilvus]|uniref:Uncharacterized protein n=1 Tax=Aurantiacibacter gilvus TaxID=3139141 RepID=A0ABU9IH10_9SPHN